MASSLLLSTSDIRALVAPQNIAQMVGAIASLMSIVGSLGHISRHMRFNKTKLRSCTLRILFVVPVFSVISWASLMMEATHHNLEVLLGCIRDFYEAIALASFMQFVLTVLGGPYRLAFKLKEESDKGGASTVPHLGPLRRCLPEFNAGAEFVAMTIFGILQFVGVMAIFSALNLLFLILALGHPWFQALAFLKAASCATALYALTLFSHEVYYHLPSIGLMLKFVAIKGIVFFTFWQGFVLALLKQTGILGDFIHAVKLRSAVAGLKLSNFWNEREVERGANDFLLCIEVLFFCVLHWFAYPSQEWTILEEEATSTRNAGSRDSRGELWHHIEEPKEGSGVDSPSLWERAKIQLSVNTHAGEFSQLYAAYVELKELRYAARVERQRSRGLTASLSSAETPLIEKVAG
eukprot:TRINITY_DN85405_c0_g1_i1.p1 TRINITY_DN85405_c0_g1~~TRINITY_DN85405_c0_g1_i1.p1  ORF type:complete len:420 (+),score=72.35 TRINITY_DN85405_c0_g1_i1:38-1261(+)